MQSKTRHAHEGVDLGPLRAGHITIGQVAGVNDEGATLSEDFMPTRHELGVLAAYYLEQIAGIEYAWRCFGQTGSYEIRFEPFARRRLHTIRQALGEADFDEAIRETKARCDKIRAEVEATLTPCNTCGVQRNFYDVLRPEGQEEDDGQCGGCRPV